MARSSSRAATKVDLRTKIDRAWMIEDPWIYDVEIEPRRQYDV